MKKNKYIIELAIAFIITFTITQSYIFAQVNNEDKSEKIAAVKSQMEDYNCPRNQDCCIGLQRNEFINIQHIEINQNRIIKTLGGVTDSAITEIPIIEITNNGKLYNLQCWNNDSLVSKYCPKCNS